MATACGTAGLMHNVECPPEYPPEHRVHRVLDDSAHPSEIDRSFAFVFRYLSTSGTSHAKHFRMYWLKYMTPRMPDDLILVQVGRCPRLARRSPWSTVSTRFSFAPHYAVEHA